MRRRKTLFKKVTCMLLVLFLVTPSFILDFGSVYAVDGQETGNNTAVDMQEDSAAGGGNAKGTETDTNADADASAGKDAKTNEADESDGGDNGGEALLSDDVTSIMGQIHWNDTAHGWDDVIRPTQKPSDPNTYVNLYQYTGTNPASATKVTLQSVDPGAPYYCVITPTEGIDYWTYSISNVPTSATTHFYAKGPAFTGYKETDDAVEVAQTGDLVDGVKLSYIEYEINYQPLAVRIMMKPASDTGKVGINVKLVSGSTDPDSASINYSGSYTILDSGNVETNGTTSNGNINNLGHNYDITLNEVPEGVAYKVTETGGNQYIVKYDGAEKGVIDTDGVKTVITNLSNNAKATLTKKWNDNMDENRSEAEFKKSLVLEFRFDEGDYLPETPESLEQQGIDGDITFEITDNNSTWEVKALHGGKENFPAIYEAGDNVISYRIAEKPMKGYVSQTEGDDTIINTKSTEFNATVNWHDIDCLEDRPEEVTYNVEAYYIDGNGKTRILDNDFLARYGIEDGKITVPVDDKSETTAINIKDIPMYSDDGYQISYSVTQSTVDGYVTKYDNKDTDHGTNIKSCFNGGVIDNTRTDWITYSAKKQWIDGGNQKARPLATVYLYRYVKGQPSSTASPIVIIDKYGKSHVISKTLNPGDDTMTQTEMDINFEDVLGDIDGTRGLFKYDENGREYVYFAKEVLDDKLDNNGNATNPKYYKTYRDKDGTKQDALYNGGTLINSRIPMVDVSIQKTWKTAAQPDAPKGTTVEFKLLRKAAGEADWTYVQDGDKDMIISLEGFENERPSVDKVVTLPKVNDQGDTYQYKLEEVSVKVPGSDDNILKDGSMQLGGHTYTYSSEVLDMNGDNISAAPTEDSNETATLTGYNTISDRMDYKVVKVWSGVDDPSDEYSATMQISRYDYKGNLDGDFDSSQYISKLTTDNGFTYTYKDLPVYDSEGYQYTYKATETAATSPAGEQWAVHYTYTYDKAKKLAVTTATNYIAGKDTYISVSKKWNDDGNTEARPVVLAQVYDSEGQIWTGKSVFLSEGNGWSGEIGFNEEEKAKLDEGITVREATVGGAAVNYSGTDTEYPDIKSDDLMTGVVRTGIDGYIYKVENFKTDNRHYNIINTRIGKTNVRLTKVWVDGSRDNDKRPELEITLSKDGAEVGAYKVEKKAVSAGNKNEWIYEINDLDKYDETGRIYDYTVSEVDTDALKTDNYKSTLEVGDYDVKNSKYHSGDVKNYTLTNKREAETEYVVNKVWRDPETTTRRPDINVNLYYSIGDSEEIYAYGEGPLADSQTEEITYRWSNNRDPDAVYDSTCTVKNLMMYSPEDGAEIHYYSMETMANRGEYKTYYWQDAGLTTEAAKVVEGQGYAANGEYIENRVEAELSLKGVKYWNNLQAGTKVENLDTSGVKIGLYQYLGEDRPDDFEANPDEYKIDEITLKEASTDNKHFAFSNVPKYNSEGKLYNYEMLETIDGRLGFVYTMDPNGNAITNSFVTGKANNRIISVDKTWNVDNYVAGLIAGQEDYDFPKITFELYRSAGISDTDNAIDFNGKPYTTMEVDPAEDIDEQGQGNIKASFPAQLIWSENGVQYKYAVVEKIGDNILPAYTIDSSRKTVNINDGNEVYTSDNKPEEKTASFTNTYEPENNLVLKGKKVWKDSNKPELRPEDITIEVYRKANGTSDSAAITEKKLTANQDYTVTWDKPDGSNEWTYTIEGPAIAEFAPNGQRWVYTVKEVQTEDITKNYRYSGAATQKGAVENGLLTDTQNMNDITNTLNGSYTVSKSWEDNNNEYALRPTTSVVALKRSSDGGATWEYVTTGNDTKDEEKTDFDPSGEGDNEESFLSHKLSYSANKWKYTFTNLAPNDEDGNPYKYEGIEIAIGYGDQLSPCIYAQVDGQPIVLAGSYKVKSEVGDAETKLTNVLDPTEIIVMKTWNDDGDAYDSRPKNADGIPQITVKLQRALAKDADKDSAWEDVKNASGKLVTKDLKSKDDDPNWKISNLPKCDFSGKEYVYRAVEITEDLTTKAGLTKAYETAYDYTIRDVTKIKNSIIYSDTKTIKAKKTWRDGESGERPSQVTLELTRWIKDDQGQDKKIAYPEPMTIVLDGTVEDDQNDSYGEMDAWEACWTNLPKQDNQGNEITYKVEEVKIGDTAVSNSKAAGYLVTSEYNNDTDTYSISNTEATEFTVEKTFAEDTYANRPVSVNVKLQRSINGKDWSDVETREIKGFTSKVNTKSTTFSDLPKYDADDNLYTYRAIETGVNISVNGKTVSKTVSDGFVAGYDVTYDNTTSGTTKITNTMNVVDISGYKTWDDQDDFYGLRYAPKDMKIKLVSSTTDDGSTYAQPDPVWENTDTNKWKFTFKGLPQYDINGDIIDYKVSETVVPNGYTASNNYLTGDFKDAGDGDEVSVTNGSDTKGIVNSLKTVNVTGTKNWAETVNGSGKNNRPDSIDLDLIANSDAAVTVPDNTLSWVKDNTNNVWTYTFSNVPQCDKDGNDITYTVREDSASDSGYTASYDKDNKNITNTIDKTTLKAKKIWNDQKNKYGTRPDGWNATAGTGIFTVYADYGNGPVKMTTQPTCSWSNTGGDRINYTFTASNLQKYYIDADGAKQKIVYSVKEETVPSSYKSTVSTDGATITNTLDVTSLSGKKVWVDNSDAYGTRPSALTLTLERSVNGNDWETVPGNPTATWTNNDNNHNEWSYSYADLPEKNPAGTAYTYRVKETIPTGYHTQSTTALNNGTLTNTFDSGNLTIDMVFGEQKDNGTADKPGATFTITDENNTRTFTVKTDKNGNLVQADDGSYTDVNGNSFWLIPGKYTMTQTGVDKSDDGCEFAIDTTPYEFTIASDGSTAVVSNDTKDGKKIFLNNPLRGNVSVLKFDEKYVYADGELKAREKNKEMLAGAEFNLCLDADGTKVIAKLVPSTKDTGVYVLPDAADGTYKTDNLGISYITEDGIICGTYWVVETANPEGYYTKTTQSPQQVVVATDTTTKTVVDVPLDVANTMIEKPFKISKTYETANSTAVDTDGAKIDAAGSMSAANNTDKVFTFTVTRSDTSRPAFEYEKTVTTDKDGIADFGDLPYGTYTVTEADTKPFVTPSIAAITVDSEGVHQSGAVLTDGEAKVENKLKRGSIEGTKTDITSKAPEAVPVKGAVMGLYANNVCLATAETDADGKYKFTGIPYGSYVVKEVQAPENYCLSNTEKTVNVTENNETVTVDSITDAPAVTQLKLHKVQNEFDGKAMEGVKFALEGKDFMGNDITREGTTDSKGNLVMDNLPAGSYKLTETKVKDFQTPDSFEVKIQSVKDGNSSKVEIAVTKISAANNSKESVTPQDDGTYTIENIRIRNSFSFTKVGTDDELNLEHSSPLKGAEFKAYELIAVNGDSFSDNLCKGTAVSDDDGIVTFENLPCGTWYIKETKAPDNFSLDEKVYKVTVNQDGSVESELKKSVNEAIRGKIEITKVDATDTDKKLSDATFKLYKLDQENGTYKALKQDVTGTDGKVLFDNLLIGEQYRIEEIKSSPGYQLSKNPVDFCLELKEGAAVVKIQETGDVAIDAGEEKNSIIWNESPVYVEFIKEDMQGNGLAGASFEIKDENGDVVESWISEEDGHTVVSKLKGGETYTLDEVQAPSGYVASAPQEFTVEAEKTASNEIHRQVITVQNEETEMVVSKVNSNGSPLKGARFELKGKLADGSESMTVDLTTSSVNDLKQVLVEGESYKLTEQTAPSGYKKLDKPVVFTLNKDNSIELVQYDRSAVTMSSSKVKNKEVCTVQIKNEKLPDNSGAKTEDSTNLLMYLLAMTGSLLMAVGVWGRRKKLQ